MSWLVRKSRWRRRVCRVYRCGDRDVAGLAGWYYEGWWDRLIMRICDVLFAFRVFYWRSLLLRCWEAALLTYYRSRHFFHPRVCPTGARQHLVLKQQTFIESARSIGASDIPFYCVISCLGPSRLSWCFSHAHWHLDYLCRQPVISRPRCQPPTPEWGAMLNEARADMVMRRMSLFFRPWLFF